MLTVAPKFNRANVQATTRARVPVERRGCAKTRTIRSQVLLGCALDTVRHVMQLTAGQRCAAVGFIKQLYLDRLWSYGLKVRAINSQSSARAAEGEMLVPLARLRNIYFLLTSPRIYTYTLAYRCVYGYFDNIE